MSGLAGIGVAIFLLAFGAGVVLTAVIRRLALRLGFVDQPGDRKVHLEPRPLGGGLAIFLATVLPVLVGLVVEAFLRNGAQPGWIPSVIYNQLPQMAARHSTLLIMLAGGGGILILGFADDLWGLSAGLRLFAQAIIALALFFGSDQLRITVFVESPILSAICTVGWIVMITNAFNLLDNMDGLSAGVAAMIAAILAAAAIQTGQYFVAALLLALLGALLGFLVFNFPPAKIFMGDAGSLFTGYLLAVSTVVFTYYDPEKGASAMPVFAFLMPLALFAVPLFDTGSVVLIRLRRRLPVFHGDQNHFSHRLTQIGLTPRHAVLTIYLATFCTGAGTVVWYQLAATGALLLFLQTVAVIGLIVIFELTARRKS